MSIEKLLETKQGAIAVKAKLKAMPDREKEKNKFCVQRECFRIVKTIISYPTPKLCVKTAGYCWRTYFIVVRN